MGYQKSFAIFVTGGRSTAIERVADTLGETLRYSVDTYGPQNKEPRQYYKPPRYVKEMTDEPFIYVVDVKWYEYEDDLDDLSRRYPEAVLRVLCIGEDALFGDICVQTFYQGRHSDKVYVHNTLTDILFGKAAP